MSYSKGSPRIELRGKLDSLNSQIILIQANSDDNEYISDIEEIRKVIVNLQKCEAAEKFFSEKLILWGLDEDEIHTRSHNPVKYYGKGHILNHYEMGRKASELNFLRTLVRETELCSVRAFGDDDGLKISHVLNRLSSALYILTYKYLPKEYNKTIIFERR